MASAAAVHPHSDEKVSAVHDIEVCLWWQGGCVLYGVRTQPLSIALTFAAAFFFFFFFFFLFLCSNAATDPRIESRGSHPCQHDAHQGHQDGQEALEAQRPLCYGAVGDWDARGCSPPKRKKKKKKKSAATRQVVVLIIRCSARASVLLAI